MSDSAILGLTLKPTARLLVKRVQVPFGGVHDEYYLKMCSNLFWYHGDAIDTLPDVPSSYRGVIEVRDLPDLGQPYDAPAGARFTVGTYRLRVVESQAWCGYANCVLDGPLAFLPIWSHRLYRVLQQISWRLIATGRVWGIVKPWDMSTMHRFSWRDVRPVDWIAQRFETLKGHHA